MFYIKISYCPKAKTKAKESLLYNRIVKTVYRKPINSEFVMKNFDEFGELNVFNKTIDEIIEGMVASKDFDLKKNAFVSVCLVSITDGNISPCIKSVYIRSLQELSLVAPNRPAPVLQIQSHYKLVRQRKHNKYTIFPTLIQNSEL